MIEAGRLSFVVVGVFNGFEGGLHDLCDWELDLYEVSGMAVRGDSC